MDILIHEPPELSRWEGRPLWDGVESGPRAHDCRDTYLREVGRERPGVPEEEGPHRRVARAILDYRIFPSALVKGILRRTPVEVGDTVGICYRFAPAVDLFFAARVCERFDEARGELWRTGFTYRTLVGHPELGEETFAVEKNIADGRVMVSLRSWSRLATRLAKVGAPLVRHLQVRASQRALEHLALVAEGAAA